MIKKGIGADLRRLRLEKGFTFEALAHNADLGTTFLKEIEAGKKQPSVTTLFKLSLALGTTPDQLIVPTYIQWRSKQE